jgi:hypothetical protein
MQPQWRPQLGREVSAQPGDGAARCQRLWLWQADPRRRLIATTLRGTMIHCGSSVAARIVVLVTLTIATLACPIESGAFEVCACVEEIPGGGGCSSIGTAVTLEPLGLPGSGPEACFADVPPGTTPSRQHAVRIRSVVRAQLK